MTDKPPAHATDWKGNAWSPDSGVLSAHPNARFSTPSQVPILAPEYDEPKGVPISAILFGGGRRASSRSSRRHATGHTGSSSVRRWLARRPLPPRARVGALRCDPMAMLPFFGYHAGDYFAHWLEVGKGTDAAKLPKVFFVNWFRKGDDGRFLWPGFGENSRVLAWVVGRLEGRTDAVETPIGFVPTVQSLDTEGLEVDAADLDAILSVDIDGWKSAIPRSASTTPSSAIASPPP